MAPGDPGIHGKKNMARFFRQSYHIYRMRNGKFITTSVYGGGNSPVTGEGIWQSFDTNANLFDDG